MTGLVFARALVPSIVLAAIVLLILKYGFRKSLRPWASAAVWICCWLIASVIVFAGLN